MSNPKISVIIPIYNVEKYLNKCIESVRNQTFQNIEIICIDDCSPDKSSVIVKKHMAEDNRIVFIRHEKNTGLGGARNTAIRVAKGEYLASADSDDYMQPNMLERLWEGTENGLFDIVSCGFNRVDEMGSILSHTYPDENQIHSEDINIFKTLNPAFWNKLWRTSLFVDNQIFFPNHDYYEDMSTTPRILSKTNSINIIKDRLYNYLVRPESITGSYGDKQIIDYFKGFEILLIYLKESGLYEKYEDDYKEYVKNNVTYHAKGVLGSDLYIEKKKQYLRNLLFFRVGFQENILSVFYKDLNDLVNLHKQDSPSYYYNEFKNTEQKLHTANDIKKKALEDKYELQRLKKALEKENSISMYNISKLEKEKELLEKQKIELLNQRSQLKTEKIELLDKIKQSETIIDESLSVRQGFWVTIYSILVKLVLSKKQKLKLKETPKRFFTDSSSKFTKNFGLFFKIIDN